MLVYLRKQAHILPYNKEASGMELQDVLRVAGVGLIIALLHVFFDQVGKKEFSFYIFFIAYLYMAAELIRFLRLFFGEIMLFFQWLTN
jgi:hypothetical protein